MAFGKHFPGGDGRKARSGATTSRQVRGRTMWFLTRTIYAKRLTPLIEKNSKAMDKEGHSSRILAEVVLIATISVAAIIVTLLIA